MLVLQQLSMTSLIFVILHKNRNFVNLPLEQGQDGLCGGQLGLSGGLVHRGGPFVLICLF